VDEGGEAGAQGLLGAAGGGLLQWTPSV